MECVSNSELSPINVRTNVHRRSLTYQNQM